MRNGDYIPTRMEAQHDAANLLCGSKTQSNPESTVGVLSMAGKGPELLVSPTDDMGKILSSLHGVSVHGKTNFAAGIQIAQLALKHRRNKHGGQRIIIFVSSPIEDETKTLVKVGKMLKKNNVAADVVSMGETDQNQEKLEEFIGAANSGDNCHLVTIPAGVLPSDVLISSPIVSGEAGGGGGGGGGGGLAAGGGGEFGGAADFGGVDPSMDPELAMALRVSMEEERARQEAASKATAEQDGTAAEGGAAAAAGGEGSDGATAAPAVAAEESKGAEGGDAAAAAPAATAEREAMQVDADDDGGLLEQALAMSMMDGDEVENMRIAMEMSMAQDDTPAEASAPTAATTPAAAPETAQPPTPTPPPASAGASANPPPAPGAGAAAADGGAGEFFDPSFVQSLLGQIPHLDPNDPRLQAAVDQAGATGKKEGEDKKEDKEDDSKK
eukprot:g16335.t1